jgi:Cdc6-like AAA superfamily ATPase
MIPRAWSLLFLVRYNPFRPGSIVSPGMFSGRYEELEGTEHALFQTKNGNPHHFLIEGERGIGKSSLLFSLQMVAKWAHRPARRQQVQISHSQPRT